ncbi:FkbM family methyltransferase [Patescibacteria group bacterium]|nr:FkbM family methyltransferase [Patescibacteria group bacterium]MBU1673297.1 FkbM family methyltransferase [Patescibacteria group bacterium]MBU1963207.1 FkbM family methyltransferase [Patescibacteria group bacterium]
MLTFAQKFLPVSLMDKATLAYKKKSKYKNLAVRENTSDASVFRQIFIFRDYKLNLPVEPKFIIDAGANAGYSTVWFSQNYPDAEIVAIEPESSNFELLEKNTGDLNNVNAIKAGLWNKPGFLKINDTGEGKWGFMTKEVEESEEHDIETITVGELLEKSGQEKIDILKIDIEGAEKEVFSSNYESWLPKVEILIIELHDRMKEGCSQAFYKAIENYSFDITKKNENLILFKK